MVRLTRLVAAATLLAAGSAGAVDGVILIDQNKALAGNVTAGDAPGFPVTLSVSGSYRLSSNLTVPNQNTSGLVVLNGVKDVTIDLNGFAIVGPVTCTISPTVCTPTADDPNNIFGSGVGIQAFVDESITIRNGTIRGMGRYAIFITGGPYSIVENVHARENALGGIWPSIGLVINNTATNNGGFGIQMNGGLIKGNQITRNSDDGIVSTGQALNIQENVITTNGGLGINLQSSGAALGANLISGNLGGAIDQVVIETSGNFCSGSGCP